MRWWKCEKCNNKLTEEQNPCFISTTEAFSNPTWCPWSGDPRDLEAAWVECGPAPHEPVKVRLAEDFPSGVTLYQAYTLGGELNSEKLTTKVAFEPGEETKALFIDGILIHPSWTEETVRKLIFGLMGSNPKNLSCDEPHSGEV